MLEYYQHEWSPTPSDWERKKFIVIPRGDFSLTSGIVSLPFSEASTAIARFSGTEIADKKRWDVVVEKNGIEFKLTALEFFKLFTA